MTSGETSLRPAAVRLAGTPTHSARFGSSTPSRDVDHLRAPSWVIAPPHAGAVLSLLVQALPRRRWRFTTKSQPSQPVLAVGYRFRAERRAGGAKCWRRPTVRG